MVCYNIIIVAILAWQVPEGQRLIDGEVLGRVSLEDAVSYTHLTLPTIRLV